METKSGIITRIMDRKKYGFIKDDNGNDLFFSEMGVITPKFEALREGMPVEFMVVEDPKGPRAIGVVTK